MLLLPRLGHCFKLATSTYQHPVERCLVWFYWCSLSSADTADRVGICSFLLAYPKEVHKPISKQNSTEFPAHSASFHTFPSGESLLWLANLRQLYEKGISDKKITRESSRAFLGGQVALTTIVTPDYSLTFILCFCCPTTTIAFPENTLQYFSGECPQPLLHSHNWSGLQNLLRIILSSICLLVQSK